jgi:Transposase domain (DUF772)
MLVALLLYSYARGNRSSRQIERACWENVAYKVISALRTPDHSTIAEFRRRHETEISPRTLVVPCKLASNALASVTTSPGSAMPLAGPVCCCGSTASTWPHTAGSAGQRWGRRPAHVRVQVLRAAHRRGRDP